MKEQILKQLKYATNLLAKIKREKKRGSIAYGLFAIKVQQEEVNRLTMLLNNKKVMKIVSYFFCFFIFGCSCSKNNDMDRDVKRLFEQLECPINSQPPSDSN